MSRKSAKVNLRAEKALSSLRGGSVWIVAVVAVVGLSVPIRAGVNCNGTWEPIIGQPGLMASMNSSVRTFEIFNDMATLGGKNELYAGGNFKRHGTRTDICYVAKWAGGNVWERIDGLIGDDPYLDAPVNDLHTWGTVDDYGLYIGGDFNNFVVNGNSTPLNHIAQWAGNQFVPLIHQGVVGVNANVHAMVSFDHDRDSETPLRLVVGGAFYEAGAISAEHVAMWDGSAWTALAGGLPFGNVYSLIVFDDGTDGGPSLFAGGTFIDVEGNSKNYIAKWQAGQWRRVGHGFNQAVYALTLHTIDDVQRLYAGGDFEFACGDATCSEENRTVVNGVAAWDGTSWSAVGGGINQYGDVRTLYSYQEGYDCSSGPHLFAGGLFTAQNGPGNRIARWDGTDWTALLPDAGGDGVYNNSVLALIGFTNDDTFEYYPDPDSVNSLFVGGTFEKVNLGMNQPDALTVAEWACQDYGCIWDIDGDGQVNPVDLAKVQENFGCNLELDGPECVLSDIDGDCQVNPVDAGIVSSKFGECQP